MDARRREAQETLFFSPLVLKIGISEFIYRVVSYILLSHIAIPLATQPPFEIMSSRF
jgi:hypothetical protein